MKKIKELIKKRWFSNAVAGCITVAFFLILSNISAMFNTVSQFFGYFSTVIAGFVLAYLMNPLAKLFQRSLFRKIKKKSLKWTLSIIFAVITVIVFLVVIMSRLIPQFADSVMTFISNLSSYADTLQRLIHDILPPDNDSPSFQNFVVSSQNIIDKIVSYIIDNSSKIINISTSAGINVINWIIAFILSVYILSAKDKLKSSTKRLLHASLTQKHYNSTIFFLTHCNNIFSRYVIFDIIDGIIVGTVNAIFMSICGMEYIGLVSVVVGITNLIPTFGPIIGAIIGGFILLMVKPFHAVLFIIFTIILQTVDGYILKPKLFGNTLGVSGLLILIFIIAGGQIFGIVGILLAIPFAAIADYVYNEIILPALERRHSLSETDSKDNVKKSE